MESFHSAINNEYLCLSGVQLAKIDLMQKSISDPTTPAKILDGLIDVGYTAALKILYQDGSLSKAQLNAALKRLPEDLQAALICDLF